MRRLLALCALIAGCGGGVPGDPAIPELSFGPAGVVLFQIFGADEIAGDWLFCEDYSCNRLDNGDGFRFLPDGQLRRIDPPGRLEADETYCVEPAREGGTWSFDEQGVLTMNLFEERQSVRVTVKPLSGGRVLIRAREDGNDEIAAVLFKIDPPRSRGDCENEQNVPPPAPRGAPAPVGGGGGGGG